MRPGSGGTTAPNRVPSTDAIFQPYPATGNNAYDIIAVLANNFTGRINGGQGGAVYQLVDVTPGTTYDFGAMIGYRANNTTQIIRAYESLKVLSVDGLTVYSQVLINTSGKATAPNAPATTQAVVCNVSGTVTIPDGVTQVRFQFDQRNGINATLTGAPGGATAPLMIFDQCYFRAH